MQAELDVQETPRKSVKFEPEIDGVLCPAQTVPFHSSDSVSSGPPSGAWLPVAAQNPASDLGTFANYRAAEHQEGGAIGDCPTHR